MPLSINTNLYALTAQRGAAASERMLGTSLQRLSSGLRITSAKDDPAGLAIANRMTSQLRGMSQAARNVNDGISMAQTAEGALSSMSGMWQRVRELAVQSANATNSTSDRRALNQEVDALMAEIERTTKTTEFNGQKLLDGSMATAQFQVGANAGQTLGVNFASAPAGTLAIYKYASPSLVTQTTSPTSLALVAPYSGLTNLTIKTSLGESTTVFPPAVQGIAGALAAVDAAALINQQTDITGVSAQAVTRGALSGLTVAGSVNFTLYGQNRAAGGSSVSANITQTTDLSPLADAINSQTAATGITAVFEGGKVYLEQAGGYMVGIENFFSTGGATITMEALDAFEVTGKVVKDTKTLVSGGDDSRAFIGQWEVQSNQPIFIRDGGVIYPESTLTFGQSVDVSTANNARTGMDVADGALLQLSAQRAQLGALQSRFEAALTGLQVSGENLSAARSRIEDADYAQETAALSSAQILQQAATAMVAQANQLPRQVLTLLG